ncbi:MAG: trypsin-like peptidase domain-containing protein [Candidatus Sumerlaeaceae bacterium]|nr:trypsin-like peptidase domain-containing protein [Candidatus Sumerlaeaceae bacterium]
MNWTAFYRLAGALACAVLIAGNPAEAVTTRTVALAAHEGSDDPVDEALAAPMDLDIAALKDKYQNAVVKIEFTALRNQDETKLNPTKSENYYSGEEPPHGSGFFISEDEIVTNAHVVEQARTGSIRIKSPAAGNVEFKVEVRGVGGSENIDLAVLHLPKDELLRLKKRSGLKKIPTLQFGDSDSVKQTDPLAIFGYPQSSDELKMIQAKVTGREYLRIKRGRFICGHQFIEVGPGATVQPGNSGGPALDKSGKVVGIPSRGSGYGSEQGFLIPSRVVLHFLDRVRQSEGGKKSLNLPKLGIGLTENFIGTCVWSGAPEDVVTFELGVLISELVPGSLAEKWGLKDQDILIGFANKQLGISCALDFGGYRVGTGRMKNWPEGLESSESAEGTTEPEQSKLHLSELVLRSNPGDDITLWYVRRGQNGIQKIEKKFEYVNVGNIPHLGTFDKPSYELWGDFVAQDFNEFNTSVFELPTRELLQGGVLVTFVEPNSLASRRGMEPHARDTYSFSFNDDYEPATTWAIIDTVDGKPVKNLAEFKAALRAAEKKFADAEKAPGYDPSRRMFLKERYVEIGFRTNTRQGTVLRLNPAFPIDEALETAKKDNPS